MRITVCFFAYYCQAVSLRGFYKMRGFTRVNGNLGGFQCVTPVPNLKNEGVTQSPFDKILNNDVCHVFQSRSPIALWV